MSRRLIHITQEHTYTDTPSISMYAHVRKFYGFWFPQICLKYIHSDALYKELRNRCPKKAAPTFSPPRKNIRPPISKHTHWGSNASNRPSHTLNHPRAALTVPNVTSVDSLNNRLHPCCRSKDTKAPSAEQDPGKSTKGREAERLQSASYILLVLSCRAACHDSRRNTSSRCGMHESTKTATSEPPIRTQLCNLLNGDVDFYHDQTACAIRIYS